MSSQVKMISADIQSPAVMARDDGQLGATGRRQTFRIPAKRASWFKIPDPEYYWHECLLDHDCSYKQPIPASFTSLPAHRVFSENPRSTTPTEPKIEEEVTPSPVPLPPTSRSVDDVHENCSEDTLGVTSSEEPMIPSIAIEDVEMANDPYCWQEEAERKLWLAYNDQEGADTDESEFDVPEDWLMLRPIALGDTLQDELKSAFAAAVDGFSDGSDVPTDGEDSDEDSGSEPLELSPSFVDEVEEQRYVWQEEAERMLLRAYWNTNGEDEDDDEFTTIIPKHWLMLRPIALGDSLHDELRSAMAAVEGYESGLDGFRIGNETWLDVDSDSDSEYSMPPTPTLTETTVLPTPSLLYALEREERKNFLSDGQPTVDLEDEGLEYSVAPF